MLVHQHALAHALLRAVRPNDPPLALFTGNDHKQHPEQSEAAVLVDGGTVGGGGPFAIGEQNVGFAEVRFRNEGVAEIVDLIDVEPLSGDAVARRAADPERPGWVSGRRIVNRPRRRRRAQDKVRKSVR